MVHLKKTLIFISLDVVGNRTRYTSEDGNKGCRGCAQKCKQM